MVPVPVVALVIVIQAASVDRLQGQAVLVAVNVADWLAPVALTF